MGAASVFGADAMVLLNNGGVLSGEVTTVDGRYRIIGDGSEMYVPESQVRGVGGSILDLYEAWRSGLRGRDVAPRLELAGWCLRQGLLPQALAELEAAAAVDPQNPRLGLLQRRLDLAMREPPAREASPAGELAESQRADETVLVARELPQIAKLPEGALEQFTRRVQPILVNNCTTSGCHRPGRGEKFELNRDWLHGLADQRSTYANLAATLAVIDRDEPGASPLLRAAGEPHGGLDAGRLSGRRQRLHAVVAEWVAGVTAPKGVAASMAMNPRRAPAVQPTYAGLIGGGFQRAAPVVAGQTFQPPTAAARSSQGDPGLPGQGFGVAAVGHQRRHDQQVVPAGFGDSYQPLAPPQVRRGGRLAPKRPLPQPSPVASSPSPDSSPSPAEQRDGSAAPIDEFDPAIFNQQSASGSP